MGTSSHSGDVDRILSLPALLPSGYSLSLTTAQQGALLWCLNLADGPGGPSPSLSQGGNWTRKLGRRVRDLGGRLMHRHGSLPTTLSRARAGVRLQPAPAAAPQSQPYCLVSSRLALRGPMRTGSLPSHEGQGDRCSSVLALTGMQVAALSLWCLPIQIKFARTLVVSRHNIPLRPQQPSPSNTEPVRSELAHRKRCWTADTLSRLDSSLTPQYDSEPDLGSPEALIP